MSSWSDTLLVALILTDFVLLATSLLRGSVRAMAIQGVLLALLPLLAHEPSLRGGFLSVGIALIKGVAMPWLLARALRDADVRREIAPYVGYTLSVLFGIGALALSFLVSSRLPLPHGAAETLAVPAALFTMATGLFLIITRRKAVNQVIGYLAMENGVFAFGVALVPGNSVLVEIGVLLDVFTAVFVMGIILFHISRAFDDIDTDRLSALRDSA